MDFKILKTAVAAQFERMHRSGAKLYRTGAANDDPSVQLEVLRADERQALWDTYIGAFPLGTDPIFSKQTEHTCSCCKNFVRTIGNVVAIIDNKLVSIWDVTVDEPGYQAVADACAAKVKSLPICDLFLHYESAVGTARSFSQMIDGRATSWEHFHLSLPKAYQEKKDAIPTKLSELRSTAELFYNSLEKFTMASINEVLDLIAQGTLYRGAEKKHLVDGFLSAKVAYDRLPADRKALYAWQNAFTVHIGVARIKSDVIGTLMDDLSKGVELDDAVKSWESKMAPTNYRRPVALVSKKQIEDAKRTIEENGLASALERRYANITDVPVTDVLFANRNSKPKLAGSVFDELQASVPASKPRGFAQVEEVGIEAFLSNILPRAESVELMLENQHAGNLVSLIAPVDPSSALLFNWGNRFSWSYNGNVTDSIKERVKKAGGSVEGDLCCRLAWEYKDDLDFHMIEPSGHEIYFGNRRTKSPSGGELDLDANGVDGQRDDPAENIYYKNRQTMKEGVYTLFIHNYSRRSEGRGWEVEIEFDGQKHNISYDKVMRTGEKITVAKIEYRKETGFKIVESMPSTKSIESLWGLSSQSFQPVSVIMLSPNFWGDQHTGNKHYFFMLEGCQQEGQARGFYNEFLGPNLAKHRKVLEMVGAKMKTEETGNQLSGLGFSSTQRASVTARVKGATQRIVKINF